MKCCDYSLGKMREPVEFQRATRTSDNYGGASDSWAQITNSPEWAEVKAVSGGERFASDRVEATVRFRVVVPYFSGLKESDKIVFRSRSHNIRFINNVELRDMWLVIDVDGGVAI